MNYRIFVEKQPRFRVEAESLRRELNANLNLHLGSLRLLCVYDLFGFTPELLEKSRYAVFGEVVTDTVSDTCDLAGCRHLAVEFLPGQFDQRAASAVDCVRLIDPAADVRIRSARLLVFDGSVTDEELARRALEKCGGTPFTLQKLTCHIAPGLMLPLSALNRLRAAALTALAEARSVTVPYPQAPAPAEEPAGRARPGWPAAWRRQAR